MKKFLVLSSLLAVVGLGVGIATRQDPAPQVVASDVTTTTTLAAGPATTSTTARVATKAAMKTTATTNRAASTPTTAPVVTTSTTRPAASTTTTTVVALHQVTPMCSISAAPAAAGSYIGGGGGTWEDVRIFSNMPKTRTRLTVQYPVLKQQPFWLTTDASGAAKKIFELRDSGTTSLSVDFYDAAENHVGGSPACQTTFMATEG